MVRLEEEGIEEVNRKGSGGGRVLIAWDLEARTNDAFAVTMTT